MTHKVVDINLNLDELIDDNGNVKLPQSPSNKLILEVEQNQEAEAQTVLVAKELVEGVNQNLNQVEGEDVNGNEKKPQDPQI